MSSTSEASAIIQRLSGLSSQDLECDSKARKEAVLLSKRLTAALENPVNTATELVFSPYVATAARIAVDLNLFDLIERSEGPVTTTQLSSASGGEELMLTRILRLLASVGFVHEISQNLWGATPTTKAMATSTVAAGHRFVWDILITSAIQAPKFLREAGHCCPTEPTNGFIQYAQQTKYNVFDFLNSKPSLLTDFNNFMGNTMGARQYWVDWFPVEDHLLAQFNPETTLLVDVGGGKGHDLQAFHASYPGRGKLVLQDLPQALNSIEKELYPGVELMVQDFFKKQQVQGARAYFLHHILHDWADKYCLTILKHLHDAMTPSYSKLLIHELILPDCGATVFQTIYDMTMMTFNGGMERSRTQWTRLLEEAGFEVVKFWVQDEDADGIIEAELKNPDL